MLMHKEKEDLREKKTERALNVAMSSLLNSSNFGKITVKDICEEALISRATFYSHFTDKYDLLKKWLTQFKIDESLDSYEQIEKMINEYVANNKKIIKNLFFDANSETFDILFEYIISTIDIKDFKDNPKYFILSNFYAGGLIYYILWHVNNRFPDTVAPMNVYLQKTILKLREWAEE